MPIKKELLDILCCPVTRSPVQYLPANKLVRLNNLIGKGKVRDVDGTTVSQSLEEALITVDGKTIYRIDAGIPVMMAGLGIPADQVTDS
jgi:uncharacterized protein YbaR (Trm112 family)